MSLESLAFLGTVVLAIAYIPQITHLIARHCAYGISIQAWLLWLIASLFILPHAVASNNLVFALLQVINLVAILTILIFSYFHQEKVCPAHRVL